MMHQLIHTYHTTNTTVLFMTLLTHSLIITSVVLTILSISTNDWLVTHNKQQQSYGLLGYQQYNTYDGTTQYIKYTDYSKSDHLFYVYRISGWIILVVLIISILHNLLSSTVTLLVYPLIYLSSNTYKLYVIMVQLIAFAVQLGCIIAFYIISGQQRHASIHTQFSTSYYNIIISSICILLCIPLLHKLYNEYNEYSYLPLVDDDIDLYDSRDVLYPLRQQQKQQQQRYQ